jgi:hypothetical protein
MNVGDALQFFHRSDGQPVFDSNGMPIRVPAEGVPMQALVTEVIDASTVNLTAVDVDGKEFVEERVYILQPDDAQPRGGRYALLPGDAPGAHARATRFGR